jgi:RimJ/RimL family protein N-acetyltransferase
MIKPRARLLAGHRIDTERLLLRPPVLADAQPIARLLGDWEVARWLVRVPYPYRLEHARAWVERSAEERAGGAGWPFVIQLRGSDVLVGSMDLSVEPDRMSGTLGYWLGQPYWGQGYATEAALAMVEFGFEVALLTRIVAHALPDNARSLEVLEKAGLVRTERRIEETFDSGRVEVESLMLDRAAWRARW